jgi:hypothetical protein
MPKRFYWYFLVLTLIVLFVTGLNSYITIDNSSTFQKVFEQQIVVDAAQCKVADAQVYANHCMILAALEAERVQRVEDDFKKVTTYLSTMIKQQRAQMELLNLEREALYDYTDKLIEYIKSNDLPVPAPDGVENVIPVFPAPEPFEPEIKQ